MFLPTVARCDLMLCGYCLSSTTPLEDQLAYEPTDFMTDLFTKMLQNKVTKVPTNLSSQFAGTVPTVPYRTYLSFMDLREFNPF